MKKTKKIAFATLVCSVALTGAIAFAACDGTTEPTAHNHKWSAWTVEEANKPTTTAGGKATRTCTGEGECDAVAAQKEYALPALNETDYTKSTKTTATCVTDGVVTYTYNKNGVQVAVDVNVGKDATNHEADCGHVAHVHNWGDGWTVIEENYPTKTAKGKATRTCSAEGCNATAADTEYVLPELTSDKYTKNGQDATCSTDGHVTYTYTDAEDEISVSFTIDTPASEEFHTWRDEWQKTAEGHWTTCNVGTHHSQTVPHDTNGKGGGCSVCGYLPAVVLAVPTGEASAQKTGVYVSDQEERVLNLTGLTPGNDYTVACEGVVFSYGFGYGGSDSFTFTADDTSANMTLLASGSELEDVTITVTDEGEHVVPFTGGTLEVGEASAVEISYDGSFYKVDIATAGNYHFVYGGGLTADKIYQLNVYAGFTADFDEIVGEEQLNPVEDKDADGKTSTFAFEANKTYYIQILADDEAGATGTITVTAGNAPSDPGPDVPPTPAGITVTPEGGTGKVADGDGTVLTLSGFTVGKTYKIEVVNGNNIGVMIVGNSTFTYVDGMTLTAKCMMPGGADAVFTIVEVVEGGETIALNKTYSVSGAAISNAITCNIELAAGYYAIYDNGSVCDVTVNSAMISMLNGSDTISSKAKVVNITTAKTYQVKFMKDSTFKVVSVPTLEITGGTVTITEANTFNNLYVLKATSGAQKSITVPAGVEVLLNDKDLVTDDKTAANFTPLRPTILAFKSSKTGDITVTIGDPIPEEESLPQLTTAAALTVTATGRGVTVVQVGKDVAAGKYTLTMTWGAGMGRAHCYFGKNISETYDDYYQSNGNVVSGNPAQVTFQFPQATVASGLDYQATNKGTTWTVTLDLVAGDKLVLITAGTGGPGTYSLAATTT